MGMRGILASWMRQSDLLQQFKSKQTPEFALHSKFDLDTGAALTSEQDKDFNHLQLDNVSMYLLFLVQIITSGLQVIYTMDEVCFVQNLVLTNLTGLTEQNSDLTPFMLQVYYVERAYRTPDYGMWERGSKFNNKTCELNSSSIGFAKAALEAINGCNLFGDRGASWSVIYVDIDAHNRNRSDELILSEIKNDSILFQKYPGYSVAKRVRVQGSGRSFDSSDILSSLCHSSQEAV